MSRIEIGAIIVGLAEYYEKQLTDNQLDMYIDDLSELDPHVLLKAVREYRKDPKNVFFPLPAKLISLACPTTSPEEEAVFISSRIAGAISGIGPYQIDRAKQYIGEIGWAIVQTLGGWQEVCGIQNTDELPILKAQWRELAKSMIGRKKRGEQLVPRFSLPEQTSNKLEHVQTSLEQNTEQKPNPIKISDFLPKKEVQPEKLSANSEERQQQIEWLRTTDGAIPFSEWQKQKVNPGPQDQSQDK